MEITPAIAGARKRDPSRAVMPYIVAVGSVAAAMSLRLALAPLLGVSFPYFTFFPAVIFVAVYGGFGPALLTTLLSAGAVMFLSRPPFYPHAAAASSDPGVALAFVGLGVCICILGEALKRSRDASGQRLRELSAEIGRRKQAEESLAESRQTAERDRDLLRTTLASIGDAVVVTDVKGVVTFINAIAQQLTGWEQHEAIGRPAAEVLQMRYEHTGKPVESPSDKAIREGVNVGLGNHIVLISRDGRIIPIEDSSAPIRNEQERVLGTVLVFRDVSPRRRSEDALQRSQERLKLALDAGKIGVWDWDVQENRAELSERVYSIHGLYPAGTNGSDSHAGMDDLARLIHPADQDRASRAFQGALLDGGGYDIDFRVLQPDGSIRWVSTEALVLRDEAGAPRRMLGAIADITEQKLAETQLRQQWETFDAVLSNIPDFAYTFDLEGRFTYANRPLLSLLEKSLPEVCGRNFFELDYPPELADRLQRQIQQVITTRQPVKDQTPFTGPSGETRHYEYIFVPVFAANGRVESVAGSTRDTTERTRAEEALRKSEERLTLALEAGGGAGVWDWNVLCDVIYCNPQFAKLYAADPERATEGVPLEEFLEHIHPDDRGRFNENMRGAVKKGGAFAEEYRAVQRDGSVHWLSAHGHCHLDESGDCARFPGVVFDITANKQVEADLRQSQERLRAIYDGTYGYMGLLAPDGTLLDANRASLEFANNTPEEVVGRPFWDCPWFTSTPGAPEAVRDGLARAAAGEFVRFEATLRRPSGGTPTFDISFHPICNEQGEVVLIVPEGREITERKRAEEELRRSNEELTRANRELEEFGHVASHDLQEPLRMVNIYTQLILRQLGVESPELNQYAAFVRQGVLRMEALIRDLLTFSQTAQHDDLSHGAADLSAAVNEAASILANRIEESGAVIHVDSLPLVRGNTLQIAHVFQNLFSNALKYQRVGHAPEIQVSAQMDGQYWIVSVRDNGIGFDPRYADRIFGLFKRLHKGEYPGTGLGLAICRRIVERYGGRIWAQSQPGEGSTFHLALPPASDQPHA